MKSGWCAFLLAAGLLAAQPGVAQPASDAGYIAGMPSAERVLRELRGPNESDTAARQLAAFTVLRNAVETLAGPRIARRALEPAELARLRDWGDARRGLEARLAAGFDPGCRAPECPRFRFNRLRMAYETSAAFKKDLWVRLTERGWRERYVPGWHALAAAPPLATLPVPSAAQMTAPRDPPAPPADARATQEAQEAAFDACERRCRPHTCEFGLPALASNLEEMNKRSMCDVMINDCIRYCLRFEHGRAAPR